MKKSVKNKVFIYAIIVFVILSFFGFNLISSADGSVQIELDTVTSSDSVDGCEITEGTDYKLIKITEGGKYTLSQQDVSQAVAVNIIVDSSDPVELVLDGINIESGEYTQNSVFNSSLTTGTAAISVQGNSECTITIKDGTNNTIVGTSDGDNNSLLNVAGISVENTIVDGNVHLATLIIQGESGESSTGVLNVEGSAQSAAIGGNCNRLTGNITINSGNIYAKSGDYGAAIGDGDTISSVATEGTREDNTIWIVGETNSVATIEINGGNIKAEATKDTPGIGTSDNLNSKNRGCNATVDIWTGMKIIINGGTIVTIGGSEEWNPSSAIGAGSATTIDSSCIVINDGAKISAVSRTNDASYPITNSGGTGIPVISTDSSANVLNLKLTTKYNANNINFWKLVDGVYEKMSEDDFPNSQLESLGDVELSGIGVALPDGTYRITDDAGNIIGDDIQLTGGGLVNGEIDDVMTLDYPPTVSGPEDADIDLGDDATFTVTAKATNKTGVLSYKWELSKDNGTTWETIDGEDEKTLTLEEPSLDDNENLYRCKVTETYGTQSLSSVSDSAKLTVTKKYDVSIKITKDDEVSEEIQKTKYDLYDKDGNYVTTLEYDKDTQEFTGKVPEGEYDVYADDEKVGYTIGVEDNSTEFEMNQYTVNVEMSSDNDDDYIIVGENKFDKSNPSGTITVLEGQDITIKASTGEERDVYTYSVNGTSVGTDDLLSSDGHKIEKVSEKTEINVEFGVKKYEPNIEIKKDDGIEDADLPKIQIKLGDDVYELDDKLPNGEYTIILDGNDSGETITVEKGNGEISFHKISLKYDEGIEKVAGEGIYLDGQDVNVVSTLKQSGYNFDGYYDNDNKVVSSAISYTIKDLSQSYELTAKSTKVKATEATLKVDVTKTDDNNTKIKVDATAEDGVEIKKYQWYKCDEKGENKEILEGENGATLNVKREKAGTFYYYCEVTTERTDNGEQAVTGIIATVTFDEIKEPEMEIISDTKDDESKSEKIYPHTGLTTHIIFGIVVAIILLVAYFKCRGLRDIK